MSEYECETRLFVMGFPWLFPGGTGDISDYSNCHTSDSDWINMLLHYRDGRFVADHQFCFYALNYIQRKQNLSHGSYFVNKFYGNGPETLDELKKMIENGNTEWINRITYFAKTVPGSAAYWRHKRRQLFSWINYHIKEKHGPPTFFMTFSCAEYKWPDVYRLLKQRLMITGSVPDDFDKNYTKYVNQYSIVVQEYFQLRLKLWLDTVGKTVFNIQHYWLRYEFAPSRGQIHAHMLAILDSNKINELLSNLPENNNQEKANLISMWLESCFNMTATIDEPIMNEVKNNKQLDAYIHPSCKQYSETTHDIIYDEMDLLHTTQTHICSKYCLKKKR